MPARGRRWPTGRFNEHAGSAGVLGLGFRVLERQRRAASNSSSQAAATLGVLISRATSLADGRSAVLELNMPKDLSVKKPAAPRQLVKTMLSSSVLSCEAEALHTSRAARTVGRPLECI